MFFKRPANLDNNTRVWTSLSTIQGLDDIVALSHTKTAGIFKHSTKCSISSIAKSKLERSFADGSPSLFLLDLITYRDVSNAIAKRFGIRHESPQLIMIKDGKAIYHSSHCSINMEDASRSDG